MTAPLMEGVASIAQLWPPLKDAEPDAKSPRRGGNLETFLKSAVTRAVITGHKRHGSGCPRSRTPPGLTSPPLASYFLHPPGIWQDGSHDARGRRPALIDPTSSSLFSAASFWRRLNESQECKKIFTSYWINLCRQKWQKKGGKTPAPRRRREIYSRNVK